MFIDFFVNNDRVNVLHIILVIWIVFFLIIFQYFCFYFGLKLLKKGYFSSIIFWLCFFPPFGTIIWMIFFSNYKIESDIEKRNLKKIIRDKKSKNKKNN